MTKHSLYHHDADYYRLINTRRWRQLRRLTIMSHPLCERCALEGVVSPSEEVHHRRPVGYGLTYDEKRRLMYDPENLMALCHRCHVQVHMEMGRSGKKATDRRIEDQTAKIISHFFPSEEDETDPGG